MGQRSVGNSIICPPLYTHLLWQNILVKFTILAILSVQLSVLKKICVVLQLSLPSQYILILKLSLIWKTEHFNWFKFSLLLLRQEEIAIENKLFISNVIKDIIYDPCDFFKSPQFFHKKKLKSTHKSSKTGDLAKLSSCPSRSLVFSVISHINSYSLWKITLNVFHRERYMYVG